MLQQVRKGTPVPSTVPSVFSPMLEGEKKPAKLPKKPAKEEMESGAEGEWNLDKSTQAKLKKLFDQQADGEETLPPALAIKCFKKSGVEEDTVKTVTKMVMRGHKGPVTFGQFVVVMFMLKKIKDGASTPATLPASLKKFL